MQRKLRSNFPRGSYLWAVRNAQWQALGIPEEDCEKPKIAIVNSSSELASCFSHLDGIVQQAKAVIRAAGAVPFEIRTAAPSDFITGAGARGAYMLATRDLIVNDIEVAVEGAQLDGMLCLASCDKTVPAQLMAAARLNVPSLVVACGYQPSGEYQGRHTDIEDVFIQSMHAVTGNVSVEEVVGMSRVAIRGPGVCAGMGTANSMHMVCEALGMALPGSTPVAANSPAMDAVIAAAGERIVAMVWENLLPRQILTPGAFDNAVRVVLSVGGSVNTVKHLQAVATEAGCPVDVYQRFEALADQVPVLAAVRPVGEDTIEAFEAAGGCRTLMRRLASLLDTDVITVTGRTVAEHVAEAPEGDTSVIRTQEAPVARLPALVVLRGNLAPESGIVKTGIVERKVRRFTGPALCFDTSDAAVQALRDKRVPKGTVMVMRGAGVRGGPAMGGGASRVVFAIDGAGLGEDVAMLTDGHLSGLVCKGLVVAEVSPEAARGGPLALVHDGDEITIDLDTRDLHLHVDDATLAARREAWQPPEPMFDRGWLRLYRHNVGPTASGVVLDPNYATPR